MTIHYLDGAEAAQHLGLAAQTVRALRSRGVFAEPDVMVGRNPGWLRETLDRWKANRHLTTNR